MYHVHDNLKWDVSTAGQRQNGQGLTLKPWQEPSCWIDLADNPDASMPVNGE